MASLTNHFDVSGSPKADNPLPLGPLGCSPRQGPLVALVLTLLFFATFAFYWPALDGGFIWDDSGHITKPELRSVQGLSRIWFQLGATQQYYPLVHSGFWLQYRLWGDDPLGYHVVNVVLHCLAACLLFLTLCELEIPGAALAAAIFALHPVNAESVAWISEQKNTLSAALYFTAALFYLKFDKRRQIRFYILASAFFLLALLSKTVTATLPGALLVVLWWKRGRLSKSDFLYLAPWFLVATLAGILTAWVEVKLVGAQGNAFALTIAQRCLLAGRVIWFYTAKILWPSNLMFVYPRWNLDGASITQWGYSASVIVVLAILALMRHRSRAPLAAGLFFIGSLLPVLGFFNVYPFIFSFVANHFQYLASVGIITIFSASVATLLSCLGNIAQRIGWGLCLLLLIGLGCLTWRQCEIYSNAETLYRDTLDKNPACWLAHNNLGTLLAKSGRSREAIDHFQQAIDLKPDYGDAHSNLALALHLAGDLPQAISHYQKALQYLQDDDPQLHYDFGIALAQNSQMQESIEQLERAVQLSPDYAQAFWSLAREYETTGQDSKAIARADKGLSLAHAQGLTSMEEDIRAWLSQQKNKSIP
jgi:protein O-mannosyl-transferase